MTKLYGLSMVMGFPCFIFGTHGWFFKIIWTRKHNWFRWYFGHTTAMQVISSGHDKWRFLGLIVTTDYIDIEKKN